MQVLSTLLNSSQFPGTPSPQVLFLPTASTCIPLSKGCSQAAGTTVPVGTKGQKSLQIYSSHSCSTSLTYTPSLKQSLKDVEVYILRISCPPPSQDSVSLVYTVQSSPVELSQSYPPWHFTRYHTLTSLHFLPNSLPHTPA